MGEQKHTALPWRAEIGFGSPRVLGTDGKGPFPICDIRGWGYLTGKGHGALGLPVKDAAAIQDEWARLIVRAVNTYPAVADLAEALEYATGALQLLPTSERDIIKFTGKWERYGSARVADILDRANDALSRFHALGKGGAQ